MSGIYIHIPFCRSKCHYCDFYSTTALDALDRTLGAIEGEIESGKSFLTDHRMHTVYFGGGTPSLVAPERLQGVIDTVKRLWDCRRLGEVTVEVNPDDVTPAYLDALRATDVNRLSIGVQSFSDRDLRLMNRRHTAAAAIRAIELAGKTGFTNLTIDLIYGIPGMSRTRWEDNLRRAVDSGAAHISAYHLTLEPGTEFGRRAEGGLLTPVADRDSERQYLMLHDMLTAAGYEHYEISNFALPGRRAVHNSAYWHGEQYLGAGPSAHSFNGRQRRWSPPSVERYVAATPEYTVEELTDRDRYNEAVMTALRTSEGVDPRVLGSRFGGAAAARFEAVAAPMLASGRMARRGGSYVIPPERYLVSDAIICEFFE